MSARETALTKADLHKIRRYIDDDGFPRFNVGKKRGLTYGQAFDEIVRATGCKTTENPLETSTWSREGIRRLGLLNDGYLSAAREFISAKAVERKVAQFNAEQKTKNEQPATPERSPAPEAPTETTPDGVPDAPGAQDLAREPQRPGGHDVDLDPGVRADLGAARPPADADQRDAAPPPEG